MIGKSIEWRPFRAGPLNGYAVFRSTIKAYTQRSSLITNIVDKIVFGILLLLVLQVPVLSDQYLQYISGYLEAVQDQVDDFKENAEKHEYPNVYVMIDDFIKNETPAVRYDGERKLQVMGEYEELKKAVDTLKNGNIFTRSWFIFNPSHWGALKEVMGNFKPAIPLRPLDFTYSFLVSLVFSVALVSLVKLIFRKVTNS